MVLVLPDWIWWAVIGVAGITVGYQYRLYQEDKVAWMNKWFDGPINIVPWFKKYINQVKADINEIRKG